MTSNVSSRGDRAAVQRNSRKTVEQEYGSIVDDRFGSLADTIPGLLGIGDLADEGLFCGNPANGEPYTTTAVYRAGAVDLQGRPDDVQSGPRGARRRPSSRSCFSRPRA